MNKFLSSNTYLIFFINLSLLFSLIFPTRLVSIRGAFFIVISIYLLLKYKSFKPSLSNGVFNWSLICIFQVIISTLIGIINNNPGVTALLRIYLFFPLLFNLFIAFNKDIRILDNLQKILVIGFIINALTLIILLSLDIMGLRSLTNIFRDFLDYRGSIDLSNLGVNLGYNIISGPSFVFMYGYFISKFLIGSSIFFKNNRDKYLNIILLLLSIILIFFSGRTGFWLGAFTSTVFTIFILLRLGILKIKRIINYKSAIFLIFMIIIINLIFNLIEADLSKITDGLLSSFNLFDPTNLGSYKRYLAFKKLTGIWQSSPIFGQGLGVASEPPTVVTKQPFSNELQYLLNLANFGIFGFTIHASFVFWIFSRLIFFSKESVLNAYKLIPLSSGLLGFLAANATNPYITKFDFLWTIFLPLGYINLLSLKNKNL